MSLPVIDENPLFASLNSISSLGDEVGHVLFTFHFITNVSFTIMCGLQYSNVVTSLLYENQLLRSVAPMQQQGPLSGTQRPQSSNTGAFIPLRTQNPMQLSYRGNVSQLEGPLGFGRRGIVARYMTS